MDAAEALGITQAGVSNANNCLGAQPGTALLLRTSRSVNLTIMSRLFHQCRQAIADPNKRPASAGLQPMGTRRIILRT